MSNNLLILNLSTIPYCTICGTEYITQEQLDQIKYVSTVTTGDIYKCAVCNSDSIIINKK